MSTEWSWKNIGFNLTSLKYTVVLVFIFLLLQGCSGGGGGGGGAPVSTAPAITEGCANTFQANVYNGTLMATDPDPISFSLDVNNPMVGGPVLTTNGGSVTLNTVTGDFTYTPSATGPRGLDTFQFRVDDPTEFSIGTETVIVNPTVMPLGDSITLGTPGDPIANPALLDNAVSYRLQLLNRLNAVGYQIEYVGGLSSGANLLPVEQRANAGYSACEDQHIADGDPGNCFGFIPPGSLQGIFTELNDTPADIILTHIGTNPMVVETDPTDTERILTEIRRWEDTGTNSNPVSVFMMQIINRMTAGGPQQQNIIDRNANVITRIMNPTMANTFPSQVVFGAELDMFTAFGGTMPTAALYVDELHPSQMGYDLMGDILFDALTGANRPAILQRCP